ncbi:MAG: polysaccharide biosynthesis protein, partial [Eubacteriales bacterium]
IPNEDIKIDYTGLRPGEKLYEELLTSEEGLIPTSNEKIFIGHQPDEDDTLLYYYMGRLKEIVHSQDKDNEISFEQGNANIEKILSSLVPTFRRISEEMQIEEKEHIDFIKNGFTPQKTTAVPAETG